MDCTCSERSRFGCYYGGGRLDALGRFTRVVLQPDQYTAAELASLRAHGVTPLAYLSLGEDAGPPARWHRPERNDAWGSAYVRAGDAGWRARVCAAVRDALALGYGGFLLDTLDVVDRFPGDRAALLDLVRAVRAEAAGAYLLANRGFRLLPALGRLVDGVLFESFATTWTAEGYAAVPPESFRWNAALAPRLRALGIDCYALDYADTAQLAGHACRLARAYGFTHFVTNRELTRL